MLPGNAKKYARGWKIHMLRYEGRPKVLQTEKTEWFTNTRHLLSGTPTKVIPCFAYL